MLRNTFIHLDGVGLATERKIWRAGIACWQDFLDHGAARLSRTRLAAFDADVRESINRYNAGHWAFFNALLPATQKWRAFGDLGGKVLFVDIETTGLTEADSITMVGVYDGSGVKTFIAGINLEEAGAELDRHALLVTFNGTCFDLPVLKRYFPGLAKNHVHIDLRYVLRWLGYKGGLKAIEREFGLERSPDTRCLGGWDAGRLWHEYQRGSREALELLKKYNEEDVRGLKPLLEAAFRLGKDKIGTNLF